MATLAIVNPRRRRRKGRKASRRRKRSSARRRAALSLFRNPKRRRRRSRKGSSRRRGRRVARRSYFGGMRFGGIGGRVMSTLKPAATAALGALSLDVIWSYLPLPAAVQGGIARHVAKGAGAVALGMVAERVVGREKGRLFAIGAMTVVLHGVLREFVASTLPNVKLAGINDDFPPLAYWGSAPNMGEYVDGPAAIPNASASGASACPPVGMSAVGVYDPLDPGWAS